jgi:hypothetical protein
MRGLWNRLVHKDQKKKTCMTNQVIGFYTRLLYRVCGVWFQVQKKSLRMGGGKKIIIIKLLTNKELV